MQPHLMMIQTGQRTCTPKSSFYANKSMMQWSTCKNKAPVEIAERASVNWVKPLVEMNKRAAMHFMICVLPGIVPKRNWHGLEPRSRPQLLLLSSNTNTKRRSIKEKEKHMKKQKKFFHRPDQPYQLTEALTRRSWIRTLVPCVTVSGTKRTSKSTQFLTRLT